jgi:hypothetical protein
LFVLSYLLNCIRLGASTIKEIRSKYYLCLQDANARVGSMSNLFDSHLYEIYLIITNQIGMLRYSVATHGHSAIDDK